MKTDTSDDNKVRYSRVRTFTETVEGARDNLFYKAAANGHCFSSPLFPFLARL